MDWPLATLILLLCATAGAWAVGWSVYPYGILILLAALVARLLMLLSRDHRQ
jgi:hypothetical protein